MASVVLIVGAGATLSDALRKPRKLRPPLDRGFFQGVDLSNRLGRSVTDYFLNTYAIELTSRGDERLEEVMSILFSDIQSPAASQELAIKAFRNLLKILNRRLAETTNPLAPNRKSNLYRIVRYLLENYSTENISIITFNQDIQIEKTLLELQRTNTFQDSAVLEFPWCYRLSNFKITSPIQQRPIDPGKLFPESDSYTSSIEVLKLHGSLNWYSRHNTAVPTADTLLNRKKACFVTRRREVSTEMTYRAPSRRRHHTFPIIVPPVSNKAAILHECLEPVWSRARTVLSEANEMIIFGYSCPETDHESANLIRRTTRRNTNLKNISIIDPSSETFQRFVELTGADTLYFYRSANAYMKAR